MEFKPGTYHKGDIVTVNGIQFVADRDMLFAKAIPTDNAYWSKVSVEPIPTTGLSPTNTPEQNSLAIEKILSIPEGSCKSIYIPAGEYRFARPIHIYRRPVYLHGDNGTIFGNSTKLLFPVNTDGIFIDRGGQSIQETIIERICLIGGGGDGSNGSGIRTNARVKLKDVTAKGFSRNGFDIWANLGEGGDASGSILSGCHSLENRLDGFFAGRVDANAISFISCDSRDNKRYGFNDDSFLGNYYFGCVCHSNDGGHFFVRDKGNARTTIIGAYCEGGSPPSELSPLTTVIGGIWASGYKLDGTNIIYK